MTTIVLPKYNGPAIPTIGTYAECLAKIGPAPKGWAYLNVGDKIPDGAIQIFGSQWGLAEGTVGTKIKDASWPHAIPTIPTKPPKLSPIGQVKKILDENPSLAKEIIALALEKLA